VVFVWEGRVGRNGEPMMYVFNTCVDLIRTLPALQHDENRPEDVDSDSEDHACDDARYACASRPWTRQPPVSEPMRGALEMTMAEAWEMADPRQRMADRGRRI